MYDYALNSPETSPLVRKLIYDEPDMFAFGEKLAKQGVRFLSGHIRAAKYIYLFGALQTVTFLRDPIQRVASEYHHFVRHYGYKGDFPSFYRRADFINRQSHLINRLPLEVFGVVGLTEQYESSLKILNKKFGADIKSSVLNVGRVDGSESYQLPEDQLKELRNLNKKDIDLYEHAVALFETRKHLFSDNLPFVHGVIQVANEQRVQGWAWHENSNDSVELEFYVDGEKLGSAFTRDLRPGLLPFNPPRRGFVGFQFQFDEPVKPDTRVKVVVANTGQVIGEMPCKASA
ncbi:hypothetical protein [Marinobacter bryozoorum]|uniref:hypothetical protein n=1 Tax=Marinobacter bryozoorum TaxID=256324 RepID=UPI0031F39C67